MTTPTPTRPAYVNTSLYDGGNGLQVAGHRIEAEAMAAAQAGQSLLEACPHPWGTKAADHFRAVWFLHTTPATASINPRPEVI